MRPSYSVCTAVPGDFRQFSIPHYHLRHVHLGLLARSEPIIATNGANYWRTEVSSDAEWGGGRMLASSAAKQALTYHSQQKEHAGIAITMRFEKTSTLDINMCRATRRAAKCGPNTTRYGSSQHRSTLVKERERWQGAEGESDGYSSAAGGCLASVQPSARFHCRTLTGQRGHNVPFHGHEKR